jgi:AcrR family transcriptional regulator
MINATPSKRRFEKNRQGILDAARTIMRETGIESLSIRTLAERVDYSPSAIYKYFDSKEAILAALREEGWQLAEEMSAQVDYTGMTPTEIMIAAGMNYLRFARTYPEHYQLMFNSQYAGPQSLDEVFNNPNFSGLTPLIEAGIKAGEISLPQGVTTLHVRLLAWFMVHGASMLEVSLMSTHREEFEQAAEDVMQAFAKLLASRS